VVIVGLAGRADVAGPAAGALLGDWLLKLVAVTTIAAAFA
jgi:hypothetical protein